MTITPSKFQQDIFSHVADSPNNLVVFAGAGAAKTTTQLMSLNYVDQSLDVALVSFGKDIQTATQSKLLSMGRDDVESRTYHSLGNANIRRCSLYKSASLDGDKAVQMITRQLLNDNTKMKFLAYAASKIWDMARYNLVDDYSDQTLYNLAIVYDIDLYDETDSSKRQQIFDMVRWLNKEWLNNTKQIDFVDMIWLPLVDDRISIKKFDVLMADEVQDTNAAELELLLASVGTKFVGVGDKNQAIFAFAGAGSDSMDIITQRTNADVLPLSISYRCTKAVKELVNHKFPHIEFDVPEWAKDGAILEQYYSSLVDILTPQDMVLCRVNADLVQLAFELIRAGKKATVRGRDIGKGLVKLIEQQRAYDLKDLERRLNSWKVRQLEKVYAADKPNKAHEITDKYDTIMAISDRVETVEELIRTINTLFSDDKEGIQGTSIHKAKGLEAERTVILRPDLMPHPMAKTPVAKQQEINLEYVAITRSKGDVIIVQ